MSLTPGVRLGPYEILAPLGAGGMGEVYRARDTRLDRTVAIKVLPAQFAADAQFRERFEREARAISQLNHPHICTLHDVGRQDGIDYLVMEYLEGRDACRTAPEGRAADRPGAPVCDPDRRRARQGTPPGDRSPRSETRQHHAHQVGREAARLRAWRRPPRPQLLVRTLSMLPTTPPMTAQGTIVGTLQYMAPEQLEGKEADARTDLFAFGAVLYEMVTGKKAFEGKSQASLIGSILKGHPQARVDGAGGGIAGVGSPDCRLSRKGSRGSVADLARRLARIEVDRRRTDRRCRFRARLVTSNVEGSLLGCPRDRRGAGNRARGAGVPLPSRPAGNAGNAFRDIRACHAESSGADGLARRPLARLYRGHVRGDKCAVRPSNRLSDSATTRWNGGF